jgi:methyl-accepting chemotaxis protein
VRSAANGTVEANANKPRRFLSFADGTSMEDSRIISGKKEKEYQYVQAVLFKPNCLDACHAVDNHTMRESADGKFVFARPGDLAGVVVVKLSMEQTTKAIHKNRAILITAALVTAILAMVASYVIVRYVIVKPVKHLRDVSDAIAAGKLNIRAQIQTNDEFEELSHAFNHMVHNLVSKAD